MEKPNQPPGPELVLSEPGWRRAESLSERLCSETLHIHGIVWTTCRRLHGPGIRVGFHTFSPQTFNMNYWIPNGLLQGALTNDAFQYPGQLRKLILNNKWVYSNIPDRGAARPQTLGGGGGIGRANLPTVPIHPNQSTRGGSRAPPPPQILHGSATE